jgi:hypothetical protein
MITKQLQNSVEYFKILVITSNPLLRVKVPVVTWLAIIALDMNVVGRKRDVMVQRNRNGK